jgi:hypothetical protein
MRFILRPQAYRIPMANYVHPNPMDSFNRIRPAWRHVIKVALMCYFATVNRHRENSIILVLVFEQQRRKVTKEEKAAINVCSTPLFAWFAVIPSSHQPRSSRREEAQTLSSVV